MLERESILDAPHGSLDQAVWTRGDDGTFVLTEEARAKIQRVVDHVLDVFQMENPSVRIIGSITSNQYSEDSDIDVHFTFDGLTDQNQETMNQRLRRDFQNLVESSPAEYSVGGHPIEVYFQPNPYQDLMSVGCYDFMQKMWLVGPDLKSEDYDSYLDLYQDDVKYVKNVIDDIRTTILRCHELALVIQSSRSPEFTKRETANLLRLVDRAVEIFKAARQCRKAFSSPSSVEDALERRKSRKWHIADSSFKLLDKFGYLKILKQLTDVQGRFRDGEFGLEELPAQVSQCVKGHVALDETQFELTESDRGGYLRTLALAAALLTAGTVYSRDQLQARLAEVPRSQMNIQSNAVQNAIRSMDKDTKLYGGYPKVDVINMIARTVYAEGRGEDDEGREAILQVIVNRAGNKKENFASVIKKPSAFSCWRAMTPDDWRNFKNNIPPAVVAKGGSELDIWRECVKNATLAFDGKFQCRNPEFRTFNAYMNPDKASKTAKDTWGKKLTKTLKNHKFGYLREYDPSRTVRKTAPNAASAKSQVVTRKQTKKTPRNNVIAKRGPVQRGFLKKTHKLIWEDEQTVNV